MQYPGIAQALIERVKVFMQEDIAAYHQLLSLSTEKKNALVKNEMDTLKTLLDQESRVLETIAASDQEKNQILEQVGRVAGMDETPTITALIDWVPMEKEKAQLDVLRQKIYEVVLALGEQNQVNQRLIETQLQYTYFFIDLMTREDGGTGFYGSSGNYLDDTGSTRRGLMDRKA